MFFSRCSIYPFVLLALNSLRRMVADRKHKRYGEKITQKRRMKKRERKKEENTAEEEEKR